MSSKTLFAPTPGPDRSAAYSEGFKQAASQNTGKTQGDAYLKHRSWQGAFRLVVGLERVQKPHSYGEESLLRQLKLT